MIEGLRARRYSDILPVVIQDADSKMHLFMFMYYVYVYLDTNKH